MKKIIFLLIVSILTQVNGIAQTKTGIELCIEYQKAFSSFASEKEANDALDKILDVIGASKNFTLIPCDDISNAVAVTVKGDRFILYDGAFMRKIDLATNNWSYLFILAHEVGHHINGHTRDFLLAEVLDDQSLADRRKEELEADEFASFIVSKLGASYAQIEETVALIASDGSDLYSTHPNYDKRIAAVKRGFERADSDSDNSEVEKTTSKRPDKEYRQTEFTPNFDNPREDVDSSFGRWYVTKRYPLELVIEHFRDSIDPFKKQWFENQHPIRSCLASATGKSLSTSGSKQVSLEIGIENYTHNYYEWNGQRTPQYYYPPKTGYTIQLKGWEDHPKEIANDTSRLYVSFEYAIDDTYFGQFITRIGWHYIDKNLVMDAEGLMFKDVEPYYENWGMFLNGKKYQFSHKEKFEFIERLKEGEKLYLRLGKLFRFNGELSSGELDMSDEVYHYRIPRYTYEFDLTGFSEAISF